MSRETKALSKADLVLEFTRNLKPTEIELRDIQDRLAIWFSTIGKPREGRPMYEKVNFSR